MKTKDEVIQDVLKSGCTLPIKALKKLKKKELQVILNKYTKTDTTTTPRQKANVELREFTDSETEELPDEKKPTITVKFRTGNENNDLPKHPPVLKRQNATVNTKTTKEFQTEIKRLVNIFSISISEMIKQFKEDNDASYTVHSYNTSRSEVETDITEYLEKYQAGDSIYEYANGLLEIQKSRIERLLGIN